MSHTTGRSRPPDKVGLTPRQYTEWNAVGRTRSTGDLSQQGLLPEVYRTTCTWGCAHQNNQIPKNPGSCALVVYIAGDTLHHQPMGAGHMIVLQLCGPMGFRALQWCHPMPVQAKRTSYCTRMITVYGARKWIQARALRTCSNLTVKWFIKKIAFNCSVWRYSSLIQKVRSLVREMKLGLKSMFGFLQLVAHFKY